MCYFIAETQGAARPTPRHWEALRATVTTLRGAKVAAQRGRTFQATVAWVGKKDKDGKVIPVAKRLPKIPGQAITGWVNLED